MRKLLFCAVLVCAPRLVAQGCSQCRDNVEQTPPQVRAAYRHAIELMAGSAAVLFTGVLVVARKMR